MEKNILKQYDSVLKEIGETGRRIRETQAKIDRMEKDGTVTDSVSGGYGGTQHFKSRDFRQRSITGKRVYCSRENWSSRI